MADDVTLNSMSGGSVVAADDVASVFYQKIKLDLGTDGASAAAVAGAGAVSTGVQRITLASDDPAVVDLAAIEVLQTTIAGDTTSLDGKVTACNTGAVTVSAALPAGTNAIGKLAANTGVDIGDVDVTSSALPTGASTSANQTTGNASLATIAGDTTSLDGKVTACNTGAVTISAALPAGTNAIGKLAANTGVDIGDVDATCTNGGTFAVQDDGATHDSAASASGPQAMGAYDSTTPTAVADGDAVRILTDQYGRLRAGVEPERFQATITSADASSATQVKAKTASKKMYILKLIFSTDTAMNAKFQDDNVPTVLIQPLYFAANGGITISFPPEAPLVVGTNYDFDVLTSVAGNVSVTITGYLGA